MLPPEIPPDSRPLADPADPHASIVPGYAVRADGSILYWFARRKRWITLETKTHKDGHVKVRVKIGDKVRELGVARTVLRAFVGPCPLGMEPYHFPDSSLSNNRLENLRWAPVGTSKVGRMLSANLPPPRRGDTNHNAVLAEADIPGIRAEYRAGFNYKEIADARGVSHETVRHVLTGETWSHVPDPDGPIVMRRKGPDSDSAARTILDWEAVDAIRAGHAAGRSRAELAREHGCSKCTIRDIIKGRTWRRGGD
jgi:hypothetical protein